jgi:hypothetical protein
MKVECDFKNEILSKVINIIKVKGEYINRTLVYHAYEIIESIEWLDYDF